MPLDHAVAGPPLPLAERHRMGRDLRKVVPRRRHADWTPSADRRDPVQVLTENTRHHLSRLLPIRYDRMRASPFAFFQGAAAIMAMDLMKTPGSGPRVQACGDCHIMNFGVCASLDGRPIFDIVDFDETLPAPFEWDLKPLATSFVLAGQNRGLSVRTRRHLARIVAQAYRTQMAELAPLDPLTVRRSHLDVVRDLSLIDDARLRGREESQIRALVEASHSHYPKLFECRKRVWRLRTKLPLVVPFTEGDGAYEAAARTAFGSYQVTLPEQARLLLDRYRLVDIAFKTAGIGAVGSFCVVGLFVTVDGAPLLLQLTEARHSVLAPFAGPSVYTNHGERVVTGQRIMQTARDSFLGWTQDLAEDQHCYVRQVNDCRLSMLRAEITDAALPHYARRCGATLAHAHARSGDAACIAGYIGTSGAFDSAIAEFSIAYAAQTKRDWRSFLEVTKNDSLRGYQSYEYDGEA